MAYASIAGVDDLAIASVATVVAPSGGGELSDQYPSNPLGDTVTAASSVRATVTATGSATPFADGTYQEIDASLSADASGVWVYVNAGTSGTGADTSTVLEIATGAGGAEANWANLQVGYRSVIWSYFVPGFIASGTRVAVRVRSAEADKAIGARYYFLPADKTVDPSAPVTMGYTAAAAAGVVLTTPGANNTEGAWVEIEDSTSAEFNQLLVNIGGGRTNANAAGNCLIDIGIGAGGDESVLIGDIDVATTTSETVNIRGPATYGVNVPAGSRLSARYQASATAADLDVFLVGA